MKLTLIGGEECSIKSIENKWFNGNSYLEVTRADGSVTSMSINSIKKIESTAEENTLKYVTERLEFVTKEHEENSNLDEKAIGKNMFINITSRVKIELESVKSFLELYK